MDSPIVFDSVGWAEARIHEGIAEIELYAMHADVPTLLDLHSRLEHLVIAMDVASRMTLDRADQLLKAQS